VSGGNIQVKIRTLLTAGAAAAVAAATALAAPSIARAANGPAPSIMVTSPQSPTSFENSSGGTVSGIVPARGTSLKKSAALGPASHAATAITSTCTTEPDCNLLYGGGPVQHTPHVYIVFWGTKWGTSPSTATTAAKNYVTSFYKGLGQSSDSWSTTVKQYTDQTGHPTFGTSLLAGTYWDDHNPQKSVTIADLTTEAAWAITWLKIADTNDADVVIATQQGTCFAASGGITFAGNCGTPTASGYCAFHDWDVNSANPNLFLPWINLPYQPDAGSYCGQGFDGATNADVGYSVSGGHEVAEAITDPIDTGWIDPNDVNVSGGEVADKCAWGGESWGEPAGKDPYGPVTFATGTFMMQSLWSNATSGCVLNGGLQLSVTQPVTQTVTLGKAVSLQIQASINGNTPLTYSATGLPPGLSINKGTGVISGTPNGPTAGTYTAKVTVAYYDGSVTKTFYWHVSSAVGQVKQANGKCLDDSNDLTTAGNKIQIYTCNTSSAQQVTFAANHELQVVGSCVTGTTSTVLEPCTGATSQMWTRQSNGEYVLKSNGDCLTDPSSTNRTQLVLAACANTASQHWSLP
jgi:hypothetical protein